MSANSQPAGNDLCRPTPNAYFMCGVIEGFYGKPWTISQRQELFRRMERFGMNTYMYAPKDDYKHRRYWRELYTEDEADALKQLIGCSKEQNIRFVYALSPGLDIVYSSSRDINVLKKKLDQVKSLGCLYFALLFDDIENDLSPDDAAVYSSFAHAQCTITNEIYDYLGKPDLFLFCPTEYCASRGIPSLARSEYLQTVGEKLYKMIDILWTGPKVVSRQISVDSIEQISKIVMRPVTIWDNIHANDYDQTRLFLGPYDGRSTELIGKLQGVLTNPNCEFEANFVAIHTLAQWSKNTCTRFSMSKESGLNRPSPDDVDMEESSDEKKKSDDEMDSHDDASSSCVGYNPRRALVLAVADWLPELYRIKTSCGQRPSPLTSTTSDPNEIETEKDKSLQKRQHGKSLRRTGTTPDECERLTVSDVVYLCNFFYLPHENGSEAIGLLRCARWLLDNLALLGTGRSSRAVTTTTTSTGILSSSPDPEVLTEADWYKKASQFHMGYNDLSAVIDIFTDIPNRELLYEMYSYISDMRSSLALVNSYIKWHGLDSPHKQPFKSGEQEPWVHRGGLLAEFRRLMPVDGMNDEYQVKSRKPSDQVFVVRPYRPADKDQVYSVCLRTCDDRMDGTDLLSPSHTDVAGDCLVGGFLKYYPQFSFVVEDDHGICGYIVAANNVKEYNDKIISEWLPEIKLKYAYDDRQKTDTNGSLSLESLLERLKLSTELEAIETLVNDYPSIASISLLPSRVSGLSVPSRLLRTAISILEGGGIHVNVPIRNYTEQEFFHKLSFTEITSRESGIKNFITLGKSIERGGDDGRNRRADKWYCCL